MGDALDVTGTVEAAREQGRKRENPVENEGKRKKKRKDPERMQTIHEFNEMQRADDHVAFHKWFLQNREMVLKEKQFISGTIRLLSSGGHVELAEEVIKAASKVKNMVSEPMYTNLAKMYSQMGETAKATGVIVDMRSAGFEPRRRTFRTILEANEGHVNSVEHLVGLRELYDDMKSTLSKYPVPMFPDEECYLHVFKAYLKVAKKCQESKDSSGADQALEGFDTVLQESFDDILLASDASRKVFLERFALQSDKWTVHQDVSVDEETSKCSHCGEPLRSIDMCQESKEFLISQVNDFPKEAITRDKKNGPVIEKSWNGLKSFLDRFRKSSDPDKRVDIVVDGANVAYYKQNFQGNFAYASIKKVLEHLDSIGMKWIVFIHKSHLGKRDIRTGEDQEFVDYLEKSGRFYVVPHGANDDWFWLYASLYLGGSTALLSNDQMRDHHFLLLQERYFQRWRDRHQVHFDFMRPARSNVIYNINLSIPTKYSKCNQVSFNENGKPVSFHFPIVEDADQVDESTSTSNEKQNKISEEDARRREMMVKDILIRREAPRDKPLKWVCATLNSSS